MTLLKTQLGDKEDYRTNELSQYAMIAPTKKYVMHVYNDSLRKVLHRWYEFDRLEECIECAKTRDFADLYEKSGKTYLRAILRAV